MRFPSILWISKSSERARTTNRLWYIAWGGSRMDPVYSKVLNNNIYYIVLILIMIMDNSKNSNKVFFKTIIYSYFAGQILH